MKMKKKTGIFIFAFLAGVILAVSQPLSLYCGESPVGNFWDFLLDPRPSAGTKWSGPLSIYYEFLPVGNSESYCTKTDSNGNTVPDEANPKAWLYFTARLGQGGVNYTSHMKSRTTLCYTETVNQGLEAKYFLFAVAIPEIYNKINKNWSDWSWKSIENAVYFFGDDGTAGAFIADIQITVK
jgi:hypothetical protein